MTARTPTLPAGAPVAASSRHAGATATSRWLARTSAAALASVLVGLGVFAAYVAVFYGRAAAAGRWSDWKLALPGGLREGDLFGNSVLVAHLLFTVVAACCALIQFTPPLRRAAPALHRASGRGLLVSALVLAAGGLWIVWARGTVGDLSQHLAISLNALLLMVCSWQAWRHARARQVERHRLWATRLLLTLAGVFFFRITLMLWLVANQGPAGFDRKTFSGPALTAIAWSVYVVMPLALHEVQRRSRASGSTGRMLAAALLMGTVTVFVLAGTAAAAAWMWWPRLQ